MTTLQDFVLETMLKRMAMLGNDSTRISKIALAITNQDVNYPAEITGAIIGLMPHIIEKAITKYCKIDQAHLRVMRSRFVDEFEKVNKIVCNAGGFDTAREKTIFNETFHDNFQGQYAYLRSAVDKLWPLLLDQGLSDFAIATVAILKHCEGASGLALEAHADIEAAHAEITAIFHEVEKVFSRN